MALVIAGYRYGEGGYYDESDGSGPYCIDSSGQRVLQTNPALFTDLNQPATRLKVRTEAPDGLYEGTRAMTIQFYTEANVKNGVQFEASTYNSAFAGLGVSSFILITGAKPVALKGRSIGVGGLGLRLEVFSNPTYTGGTPISIYNMNYQNAEATTVQILALPTVTGDGTKIACDKYALGSNLQGAAGIVSNTLFSEANGLETIFAPNSVYHFKNTSLDPDPQFVFSYQTWYEGALDLPLP